MVSEVKSIVRKERRERYRYESWEIRRRTEEESIANKFRRGFERRTEFRSHNRNVGTCSARNGKNQAKEKVSQLVRASESSNCVCIQSESKKLETENSSSSETKVTINGVHLFFFAVEQNRIRIEN